MVSSLPSDDVGVAASKQPQLLAAYISTFAFAVIAVCLRFVARKVFSNAQLWWDDYAICTSSVRRGLCTSIPHHVDVSDLTVGVGFGEFCDHAHM